MTDEANPGKHMMAAAERLGGEYFRVHRRAMAGDARAQIQLVVITLPDYRSADWLALPAHLPSTEKEQRALLLSTAESDGPVRRGLRDWARDNRYRRDHAGVSLTTIARAYLATRDMLEDAEGEDHELVNWRGSIAAHVRAQWGVEVGDAPDAPADVERWAMRVAGGGNPSPDWLITGEARAPYRAEPEAPREHHYRGPRRVGFDGGDED